MCTYPAALHRVEESVQDLKRTLAVQSRMAKYWLLYMHYVSILKTFLRAERSGDWNLHLATIRQMVHLFAATGHTNYAKCARLYVEMMTNLPNTSGYLWTVPFWQTCSSS